MLVVCYVNSRYFRFIQAISIHVIIICTINFVLVNAKLMLIYNNIIIESE